MPLTQRRKYLLSIGLLVVLGLAVLARASDATAPENGVNGWDRARFGMTREEIQQAFPGATQSEFGTLKIMDVEVNTHLGTIGGPVTVSFYFHEGRLDAVALAVSRSAVGTGLLLLAEECRDLFLDFAEELQLIYGEPLFYDAGVQGGRALWEFPNQTLVRASVFRIGSKCIGSVTYGLRYTPDRPTF